MKILCFTDNHFCEKCSIIQRYGTKYSMRLENQLQSLNWVEEQALYNGCDAVVCLGDFFDKPELNEQEITAIKDIKWNNLPHYFIVGNHESSINTLQYSSAKVLEAANHFIIDQPATITLPSTACELCFLPYIIESDRKPLKEYFGEKSANTRIIFSHNDLKGIQMGPVVSRTGFEISDIEQNCNLFLNGHLHNGQAITNKVINLGNLTGKDFGENAAKYSHNIFILDLDSLAILPIENPFAFNFYKLDIESQADLCKLDKLKNQSVLSVKCREELLPQVKQKLEELKNKKQLIEFRIIITKDLAIADQTSDISDLTVDHLAKFVECCKEKIADTAVLEAELAEICK